MDVAFQNSLLLAAGMLVLLRTIMIIQFCFMPPSIPGEI